jgi:hypothetical protein
MYKMLQMALNLVCSFDHINYRLDSAQERNMLSGRIVVRFSRMTLPDAVRCVRTKEWGGGGYMLRWDTRGRDECYVFMV